MDLSVHHCAGGLVTQVPLWSSLRDQGPINYADGLVIIADWLEECVSRLLIWKEAIEKKGLLVKAGMTKVMICGTGLDLLQSSGKYTCCTVCCTGVGNNNIYCNGCKLWVH